LFLLAAGFAALFTMRRTPVPLEPEEGER